MNLVPEPGNRLSYFGRVSTPRQKLEHHWATVERWLDRHNLTIPPECRFEDKIRRCTKRPACSVTGRNARQSRHENGIGSTPSWSLLRRGRLTGSSLQVSTVGASVIKMKSFIFRSKLREYEVQLYSVVDELNITSADDSSFWRVAGAAEGATRYVSQQAEKNIEKMVSMAQQGWATTGNAPFGLDLVCYLHTDVTRPLYRVIRMRYKPHLYKLITYTPESLVERDANSFITQEKLQVASEVITELMPPRDKKATGYRYEPSVESSRLEAVEADFPNLYASGMEFAANLRLPLWDQGYKHYDKPFGYHGVETILSNSAYVGLPAWGKVGVGEYRHCIDKQPRQV